METIIQQIAVKFIEQILNNLSEKGINDIGQTTRELFNIAKSSALEIVIGAIDQMDTALVSASRVRREDGLRIKERKVPRTILTDLGELRYQRTYFESKGKERCYLVDHLIGVEAYERVSKELCASLVQRAADRSMEKAAKDLGVEVSRQTVNNKVLAMREVASEAVRMQSTPKELHIFADEDHVHLKNGRNAIVPLVTVTEGIDERHKRHKTINAIHFEGYGISNASLFENISSFLHERYDMDRVERIYVHADGGNWIAAAADWIPHVTMVMDGFHLEKRLRKVSRLEGAAPYMGAIRKAIKTDDFKGFASLCMKLYEKLDKGEQKALADNIKFIENNWEAIVCRMTADVCGSCTEPLVSHVLSKRLIRNPLAWSEHGLRQMAMLRVYVKNGGVVRSEDIRVSRSKAALERDKISFKGGLKKYRAYADNQMRASLGKKFDWNIFDSIPFRSGKLDPVHILQKAYGAMRNTFASA